MELVENLELEGINKILKKENITVLGIETSCDETAVSLVSLNNGKGKILSNKIISQCDSATTAPHRAVTLD